MALQSQAPRSGGSRRYTTSSRGKKGLAPWLALVGVAIIIGGLYLIFSHESDPVAAANASEIGDEAPADTSADTPVIPNVRAQSPVSPTRGTATAGTPQRPTGTGTAATSTGSSTPPVRTPQNQQQVQAYAQNVSELRGAALDQYETGMQRLESGDIATGRALLSELLFRPGALPINEAQAVRERLTFINDQTVFSNATRSAAQAAEDPILAVYRVQSGDRLGPIGNTYRLPYQLIERINGVSANRIRVDQPLQLIRGPIHARIDKSEYRMDLFVYDDAGLQIYLRSYPVGLGEFDSTPVGMWRIRPGSKVGPEGGGPSWSNPRTGENYDRNDPNIPIGEYWMGLEGTDDNTRGHESYGIHATNDQDSIGRQESMGCIRMRDADIDQVFYMLYEGASTVEIAP